MYLLVLEVLFIYIHLCCSVFVDLFGFMLIMLFFSCTQKHSETIIRSCFFRHFGATCRFGIALWHPIGIKTMPKVSKRASQMHNEIDLGDMSVSGFRKTGAACVFQHVGANWSIWESFGITCDHVGSPGIVWILSGL